MGTQYPGFVRFCPDRQIQKRLIEYNVIVTVMVRSLIVIVISYTVVELRISKVEVGILALRESEGIILGNIRDLDVIGHSDRVIVAARDYLSFGNFYVGIGLVIKLPRS